MTLADVNGDGRQDVITANTGNNSVTVLPGNGGGDGTFADKVDHAAGFGSSSLVAADFNKDTPSILPML